VEMVTEAFLDEIDEINQIGGGREGGGSNVVLEFGLQTIHKEEMKAIDRPNRMSKVSEVLTATQYRNINAEVSLIFGLPRQTLQSFQQSIDYCINHQVKVIHAFPLMLLRGTPLYEHKEMYGLIESNEIASDCIPRIQNDIIPHVVQSDTFSYSDWKQMAVLAEKLETEYNIKSI